MPVSRSEATIACVALLAGLTFAVVTQHVWEDYWITFRIGKNLATGHGLVFTPGERLHTFTSPLGVLLPAGFSRATGSQSDELPLWLFRIVSVGALAVGLVLLFCALQTVHRHRFSSFFAVALMGLDAKILDFSINGMETGLLFFFLALTIHGLLLPGPRNWLRTGIGWAGLMWTRPDSCVYIALLGLGAPLFLSPKQSGPTRRETLKSLSMAALVCAVLYLPWFVWAWVYYGSPVPHTVVAKGTNVVSLSVSEHFVALFLFVAGLLTGTTSLKWTLLPAYASLGGWYESLHIIATALGLLAVFAWILPAQRRHTRLFSLAYFFGNYFLTVVVKPVPWYLPTVAVFGYLTLASLFDQTLDWTARLRERNSSRPWLCHLPRLVWAVGIVIAMGQFAITVCVARQMQVQQAVIENGLRREIGLWLRDHAETPGDTVTLEPLGYIGYFSGLKMLDFPGLASKEVVEARRRLGPGRDNLVHLDLKPDWLVLRPAEIEGESYIQIHLLRRLYELVQVFDATDKVRNTAWLPGRPYLEFDQKFFVFHRKADASADSQLGKD